ncbi:MAG: permease-like cell division protein FtsX [Balneolales bacterium]
MSTNYVIKEGFAGFKRAKLAAFTSVTALAISVLLLGVLARFAFNALEIGESLRTNIDVEVFLMDMEDSRIEALRTEFANFDPVSEINYISKDSAAVIFREQFGTEGNSLADLNFLPASLKLHIHDETPTGDIIEMVSSIEGYRGVDEVLFNQQLLEVLEERMDLVITAGGGIGLLVLLTALVLVFNTIRLTIYAKRSLIKAMKLVGATNGFIRRPFLLEGMLQGLLAGVLALVLLLLIFQFMVPHYIPQFGVLSWPFEKWYYLSGTMIFVAVLMGYFGSNWASRKFIRESTVSGNG